MNNVCATILVLVTIALSAACGSTPPDGSGGDGGGTSSHASTTGTNNPASTGTGMVDTCPAEYPTECIVLDPNTGEHMVACVDLQTDRESCGECGKNCSVNGSSPYPCAGGVCQIPDGSAD